MADVVQFFLKMADEDKNLLAFGLDRAHIAMAAENAQPIIEAIKQSGEFRDDAHAAQHGLAEAIVANGHLDPDVQHVMAPVVVYLASDTEDKRAMLAGGVKKAGFVLTPGKKAPELIFEFTTAK